MNLGIPHLRRSVLSPLNRLVQVGTKVVESGFPIDLGMHNIAN